MSKRFFAIVFSLSLYFASGASAQTPEIDADRWTTAGGVALAQAQGTDQGDPMALTWGFAQEGTLIPFFGNGLGAAGNSNLIARMDTIYGAGPGGSDLTQRPWFALYESSFARWASISGLSYQYEANDDGAAFANFNGAATRGILGTRADVRISGRNIDGNSGVLAFNFFPTVGDMVIDTNDNFFSGASGTANNSRGLRNVLAHEHGHGIGMSHLFSNDSNQLMEPFINNAFDGPQYHDILVAQRAYGDANEKSFGGLGNDVATRATSLGNVADAATVSVGQSAETLVVANDAVEFFSIDDSSDTDFWSFSIDSAGDVDVLLEALGFSYLTQPQGSNGQPTGNNVVFNTQQRSDLALSLFDTDGTTLLASVDATGLGGDELISSFFLDSAGTYFLSITGQDNVDAGSLDTQFYGLSVSFSASAVPEPATAGLVGLTVLGLVARRRRS